MKRLFFLLCFAMALPYSGCDESSDTSGMVDRDEEEVILATAKVMSYNIHHANPPAKPDVIDLNAIIRVIRAQDPDFVALQEVDVNTERSGPFNQAKEIAKALNMHYFFAKAIDYQGGEYGVAILSKYRLSETTVYHLPSEPGNSGEPRVMAAATVKLSDSTALRFGSTHLDAQADPANRKVQIDKIKSIVSQETLPFILAGDFNATPESEIIRILDSVFNLTCRLCPPTIPVGSPTKTIDYIAFRHPENKFAAENHKVIDERYASDHRPISATINLVE